MTQTLTKNETREIEEVLSANAQYPTDELRVWNENEDKDEDEDEDEDEDDPYFDDDD